MRLCGFCGVNFSLSAARASAFRYLRRDLNGARANAARLKFAPSFKLSPLFCKRSKFAAKETPG